MVVIPDDAKDLQQYLLVLNHEAGGVHPSARMTAALIRYKFDWLHLAEHVDTHVKKCLVCLTSSDHKRPVQQGSFRTAPGVFQLLGMDFADMGIAAASGQRHVLMMVDLYSHRVRFVAAQSACGRFAAQQAVLWGQENLDWSSVITDSGSHFKNEFMDEICKLKGSNQFFTLPLVEYPRGLLEGGVRVMKNTVRKLAAACNFRLSAFPALLAPAASIVNNMPSVALRGHAPNTLTFGQARLPSAIIAWNELEAPVTVPVPFDVVDHVENWGHAIRQVCHAVETKRLGLSWDQSRSPRRVLNDFAFGDHVFLACTFPETALSPRWSDLSTVLESTGPRIFRVKSLISGVESERHVSLLRLANGATEGSLLASWDLLLWNALTTHMLSEISEIFLAPVNGHQVLHCTMIDLADNAVTKPVNKVIHLFPRVFQALLDSPVVSNEETHAELLKLLAPFLAD